MAEAVRLRIRPVQIVLVVVEQDDDLVLIVEPTRTAVACPGFW